MNQVVREYLLHCLHKFSLGKLDTKIILRIFA